MGPEVIFGLALGAVLLGGALLFGGAVAAWHAREPAIELLEYQVASAQSEAAKAERQRDRIEGEFDRYVRADEKDAGRRAEIQVARDRGALRAWVLRDAEAAGDPDSPPPSGSA